MFINNEVACFSVSQRLQIRPIVLQIREAAKKVMFSVVGPLRGDPH